MPKPFMQLARESFFQPRTAAPSLIGLNLPRDVIAQAVLLLAVLTVLSQYLLFTFINLQLPGAWIVEFPVPVGDVALQFVGAYVVSQIVVMMARGLQIEVRFTDAMVVYLWFNLLMVLLLTAMIVAAFVIGPVSFILILFTIFWGPYAMAVFWAELLQTKNLFLGFVVAVLAILIGSAISVIAASILGLPMMEIIPNV